MTPRASIRRRIALLTTGAGLALVAFAVFAKPDPRLVWNGSASVPRGLYWIDKRPPQRGDLVLARAPNAALRLGVSRGYLPSEMPVVKRLVGVEGDEICRLGRVVSVNGRGVALAQLRDLEGRLMPSWRGCVELNAGEVLLLADHPDSFDGRYWGKSDHAGILGVAQPVWTFGISVWRERQGQGVTGQGKQRKRTRRARSKQGCNAPLVSSLHIGLDLHPRTGVTVQDLARIARPHWPSRWCRL